MKVKVDQDKCIACGACVAIAPENFDFNEEGLSTVINEEVTDNARSALEACPVYAISIDEGKISDISEHECGETCKCGDTCECEHKHEVALEESDDNEELEEAA